MLTTYKPQRLCQGKEESPFSVCVELSRLVLRRVGPGSRTGSLQLTWEVAGSASGLQEGEGGSQRQEAFTLGPWLQPKITSFPAQSAGGRAVLALGLAAAALLLMCETNL